MRDEECFSKLPTELARYRQRVSQTLKTYREKENKVVISPKVLNRFLKRLDVKLKPFRCRRRFLISLTWPDGRGRTVEVSLDKHSFKEVPVTTHSAPGLPLMIFPAMVFRDAVFNNMFHHAGISKRCKFLAQSTDDMRRLKAILWVLEKVELGFYPLSRAYLFRLVTAYRSRSAAGRYLARQHRDRLLDAHQELAAMAEEWLHEGWTSEQIVAKLKVKIAAEISSAIMNVFWRLAPDIHKSITFDNGSEFTKHALTGYVFMSARFHLVLRCLCFMAIGAVGSMKHLLENTTGQPFEIIEVQVGDYPGEDGIA